MIIREVLADAKTGETTERLVEMTGVMTVEEAGIADLARQCDEARAERNARLLACDWTALSDATLDAIQRAAWATYRQALRDVTGQAGFPTTIIWPAQPA